MQTFDASGPVDAPNPVVDEHPHAEADGASTPRVEVADGMPEPLPGRDDLPEFKLFRYGDGTARILSCVVRDEWRRPATSIEIGRKMMVEIVCEFHEDRLQHLIGFYIKDRLNLNVIGINTHQEQVELPPVHSGDRYAYHFEFQADIRPGYYSVCPSIAYSQLEHKWMDYIENAELFRVVDPVRDRTVFGVCLPAHRSVRVAGLPREVDDQAARTVEA
jgi:hypothetical protein